MLQNLNAGQSWHQGDSDYTEPIEIIAVVTESLTGMCLCDVFWEKSKEQVVPEEAYHYVEGLEALEKCHVYLHANILYEKYIIWTVPCLDIK